MILGIIVFAILFVTFVVFGTLLICGRGYAIITGYRSLTDSEKEEFVSKNNLKKIFAFYAYYCYAVALVTLLALIGACCNSMVVIFVSYLLFGAGTIATIILANVNTNFKVVPINKVVKSVDATPVAEVIDVQEVEIVEAEAQVKPKVEEVESTPAKKTTTKSKTTTTKKSTTTTKSKTTTSAKSGTKTTAANKTTTKVTRKPAAKTTTSTKK